MFPGPVTNLVASPNTLFSKPGLRTFKVHSVVKPHIEANAEGGNVALVPGNYTFKAQLSRQIDTSPILATEANEDAKPRQSVFEQALTHSSFPMSVLEEGLAELADWHENQNQSRKSVSGEAARTEEDFMALDTEESRTSPPEMTLQDQNEFLRNQVASLQRVQKVSFEQLNELRRKNKRLLDQVRDQKQQTHQNPSER
jgi:pre-rRNA-processing protein IPI3